MRRPARRLGIGVEGKAHLLCGRWSGPGVMTETAPEKIAAAGGRCRPESGPSNRKWTPPEFQKRLRALIRCRYFSEMKA